MHGRHEEMAVVRQEMLELLRQQMEALNSPLGLTDALLTECYERQARVQELREQLQALAQQSSTEDEAAATASCSAQTIPAPLDTSVHV